MNARERAEHRDRVARMRVGAENQVASERAAVHAGSAPKRAPRRAQKPPGPLPEAPMLMLPQRSPGRVEPAREPNEALRVRLLAAVCPESVVDLDQHVAAVAALLRRPVRR